MSQLVGLSLVGLGTDGELLEAVVGLVAFLLRSNCSIGSIR